MPRKETYTGPISAKAQQELVSEGIENFELPKSVVMKIAKSSVPDNVKLQKETVLSLVKGSTVFINYLAATAHDVAQSRQHKSISASDVLKALEMLEFADMSNRLQSELVVYRDVQKGEPSKTKKNGSSSTASKKATTSSSGTLSKGKGKEKAAALPGNPLPPPFTSTPLDLGEGPADSISGVGVPMDVDEDGVEVGADEEFEEDEQVEDDIDEDVDDEIAEAGGLSDEERELTADAKGLDERIPAVEDD